MPNYEKTDLQVKLSASLLNMRYLCWILLKVSSQHTFNTTSLGHNMLMMRTGRTLFVNRPIWYLRIIRKTRSLQLDFNDVVEIINSEFKRFCLIEQHGGFSQSESTKAHFGVYLIQMDFEMCFET